MASAIWRGGSAADSPPTANPCCITFSLSDLRWVLQRAGLRVQGSELCNIHQGVYHLTYHSKLLGLLLRHNYYTARMTGKTPEFDDGNRVGYRYLGWSRPPQGAGAGAASLVYGRITEA